MKKNIEINGESIEYEIEKKQAQLISISVGSSSKTYSLISRSERELTISDGFKQYHIQTSGIGHFMVEGHDIQVQDFSSQRRSKGSQDEGQMISPMPGKIFKLLVKEGQSVVKGDPLLIMEAMKMEHTIKSSADGVISKIMYKEGEQVTGGVELVIIDAN